MAQDPNWQKVVTPEVFQGNPSAMSNRFAGQAEAAKAGAKVVGRNAAFKAITDVAKVGLEYKTQSDAIQKTEDLANVRQQLGEALDPLIQEGLMGSPTYKGEQADLLAGYQEVQNRMTLVGGPEDSETLNQNVSRVQSEIDNRVEFLKRAKDQRRMSAFTFEQNVKAISRKFISDNPALRAEILETVKGTLEDQGIVERLKEDESLAKTQKDFIEEDYKFVRQELKDLNIPDLQFRDSRTGQLDIMAAKTAIDIMRKQQQVYKAVKDDIDFNRAVTDDEVYQVERSGLVPALVGGAYSDVTAKIANIFQENPTDFPKAKLQAKALIAQEILNIKQDPRITRYAGSQVVKDGVESLEKQLTALANATESYASMEDLQKFTSNARMLMTDQQSMRLMQDFDVPRIELMMKIGQVANLINSSEGQSYMKDLIINSRDLFNSGKLTNGKLFQPVPGSNKNAMTLMLGEAATNPQTRGQLDTLITANIDGINNVTISKTPQESFMRADDFINETARPDLAEAFIDLSPEASTKYKTLLDEYNNQLSTSLNKYLATNPNKDIKVSVNPSTGRLLIQGADAQFNNDFTTRIDKALKSYANLRVQKPSEVWKDFYQEYYSDIMLGKFESDAAKSFNPLNLKDTDGKFRSFSSLDEAVPAYENQISRYAQGLTDGKKRTSIKDIVDLWRPASDRRGETDISQEEYYRVVADTVKKSPTTKLDLSDKETMAKLIAGMSIVEGNPIEWLRVSSLLKGNKVKKGNLQTDQGTIRKARE